MAGWVLILTIWGVSSQSGRAIAHVDMPTEESCMVAARAWQKEMTRQDERVWALCVKK